MSLSQPLDRIGSPRLGIPGKPCLQAPMSDPLPAAELIQQALQASEVKLYPERFREEAPEDKQEGPSQG